MPQQPLRARAGRHLRVECGAVGAKGLGTRGGSSGNGPMQLPLIGPERHHQPTPPQPRQVLFALRYMIDCGIVGGNWVELPAGKYNLVPEAVSGCVCDCHGGALWGSGENERAPLERVRGG